jgi:hypothetical protein
MDTDLEKLIPVSPNANERTVNRALLEEWQPPKKENICQELLFANLLRRISMSWIG